MNNKIKVGSIVYIYKSNYSEIVNKLCIVLEIITIHNCYLVRVINSNITALVFDNSFNLVDLDTIKLLDTAKNKRGK